MSSLRRNFGKRLRSLRRGRDLSQELFAELLGISVDFLSLIERGRNSPSFDTLELIADRLHLPVKELFDFPAAVSRKTAPLPSSSSGAHSPRRHSSRTNRA
jgi:transcriptional regulator with XRE-family HTH domain